MTASAAHNRTILRDVAFAYVATREAYERAMRRGDVDRADQCLTRLEEIESAVTVVENNRGWRQ